MSLPKLSLITLPPPLKRRDSKSAGYMGGPVNYPSRFISWVYRGEYFSRSSHGENLEKFIIMVDMGFEPTTPNNPCPADDAIC